MVCIHVAFLGHRWVDPRPLLLGFAVFILRFIAFRKNTMTTPSSPSSQNQYQCGTCGYIYDENKGDPDGGITPGTKWEDIPDTWKCPVCGVGKNAFTKIIRKTEEAQPTT